MKGWRRAHSVRMKLTLWHVAVMATVLTVYSIVIFALVSRSAGEALNDRLRAEYPFVVSVIDRTPEGDFTWNPPAVTSQDEELPWVQVWSEDGQTLLFENFQAMARPIDMDQRLAVVASGDVTVVPADPVPMRVLSRRNSIYGLPVVIQVARSEAEMRAELQTLMIILIVGLPLAVAVAGAGGYVLARGALAPVERMTEQARLITAERLGERLPVVNPDDEMGRLATVFNETLGRLEASFEQMRRFTADVSHQLRTPLTSIRSVGEVGLRGQRDEASYRGIIESMLEEAERLATLVDRLLTLSRAESGQSGLTPEPVDLRILAEEVTGDLAVLAEEKRQTLVVEGAARPQVLADRSVLRQALLNLVDNAIKFTSPGGRIAVRVSETARDAILEVIDTGPGVPEEARDRIFERFYRADDNEGSIGAGLGLSIARSAVEANRGRLTLEPSEGGSRFRITLPRRR